MKLPKFRRPHEVAPFDEDSLILPPSIRMCLANNEGETDSSRLASLFVPDYRQQRFGFYLLMKAAAENDGLQKRLLHSVAANGYDFSHLDGSFAAPGLEYLAKLSKPTVEANKLAEVSRYGIGTWMRRYNGVLDADNDRELFVLAHATLIGFDALAHHTLLEGKPLTILKPNRFAQIEQPVGFQLKATGESAADLSITDVMADFERPEGAVLFDDIRRTGAAYDQATTFWMRDGSPMPDFHTAVDISTHGTRF